MSLEVVERLSEFTGSPIRCAKVELRFRRTEAGRWTGYCPQLEGVEVDESTYDDAYMLARHKLGSLVTHYRNARPERPIPWRQEVAAVDNGETSRVIVVEI